MPRAYNIEITPPPGSGIQPKSFTSIVNGQNDSGALNVEMDFFTSTGARAVNPSGDASTLTIQGISIADLQQGFQYGVGGSPGGLGSAIVVQAGMRGPGLPLIKPAQYGTILVGQVYQSWGNWVGTEVDLNFVIMGPGPSTPAGPANIVFQWAPKQSLASAITNCLQAAFPSLTPSVIIGTTYNTTNVKTHQTFQFPAFARFIRSLSSGAIDMAINGKTIVVFDSANPVTTAPIQLDYNDLIGQPTWIEPYTLTFTTVMRSDIEVGAYVKMPQVLQGVPGGVQTSAGAYPSNVSLKYQTIFQGQFRVTGVRQVGNFRDPAGASWGTVFRAYALPSGSR